MNKQSPENHFRVICDYFTSSSPDIKEGKMMHSPAIKYGNRVAAFYHKGSMVFRLGKSIDIKKYGVSEFTYLSPFKTKPPLKAWYIINADQADLWHDLTELALDFTASL